MVVCMYIYFVLVFAFSLFFSFKKTLDTSPLCLSEPVHQNTHTHTHTLSGSRKPPRAPPLDRTAPFPPQHERLTKHSTIIVAFDPCQIPTHNQPSSHGDRRCCHCFLLAKARRRGDEARSRHQSSSKSTWCTNRAEQQASGGDTVLKIKG